MRRFTVNIVPKGDDKRIPVKLAGQVMVCMQDMLYHVGEYCMSKELRAQGPLDEGLLSKFTLYIDSAGGMSMKTTSGTPETKGYGNIVDDALALLESTLDALGGGIGGYWMEDHYSNPFYRNAVIDDVLGLYARLQKDPGYALVYGSGKTKEFGRPDTEKLSAFVREKGLAAEGAAIGVIRSIPSKSRRNMVSLRQGKTDVRLKFTDPSAENAAGAAAGKGPVEIRGMLRYSRDNAITDVSAAKRPEPIASVSFRRMISSNGDVELKAPVTAAVSYDADSWMLRNDDLGIVISKPDWDSAVQSFHDYFVFLWVHYTQEPAGDFGDEEKEVRETLMSLVA